MHVRAAHVNFSVHDDDVCDQEEDFEPKESGKNYFQTQMQNPVIVSSIVQ